MATKIKPGGKILLLVILVGLSVLGYKMYLDKHPELAKSLTTGQANAMPESTLLLTLSGSNTIGDSLVPALVKAYMEAHSFTDVSIITIGKDEKSVVGANGGKKSRMDISAHGTSTGFASLNAGADICMASAPAPAG